VIIGEIQMDKKKLSMGVVVMMILASATFLLYTGTVEAHPPSDVSIDYDIADEELTVSITHSVGDPQSHYIYNVVVEVDGDTVIDQDYQEQPDDTNFQYTYDLVAGPGSVIEVTAYCNQAGSGSDTFEVGEENDDEDDTPGFALIVSGVALVSAVLIYDKKKRP